MLFLVALSTDRVMLFVSSPSSLLPTPFLFGRLATLWARHVIFLLRSVGQAVPMDPVDSGLLLEIRICKLELTAPSSLLQGLLLTRRVAVHCTQVSRTQPPCVASYPYTCCVDLCAKSTHPGHKLLCNHTEHRGFKMCSVCWCLIVTCQAVA